jgi:outer membrane protein assembly factor BamB
LAPVTTSPTVTPGGYVFVTVGQQFSHTLACIPFGSCGVPVTYTIERLDPHDGSVHGAWGLGGGPGFVGADTAGNILPGSGFGGPSSAAYDAATGLVFAGEPNVFPDVADGIFDMSSGVIALHAPDSGGGVSFAWEQRWTNNLTGVGAAPAVSGGRVFVASVSGLRSFDEAAGTPIATISATHSEFSSPAVAAGTVFAATDNGYTRALDAASLAQVWTSGQALDGGNNPVDTATPVVVGENDTKGVVPYLVFDTNGNGDLKAFNAAGSGTNTAVVTINDHGTGKGGIAISGGVVFVQGTDGQLRAFGR